MSSIASPSQPAVTYDLASLPQGAMLRGVTAEVAVASGRQALRVELTQDVRRGQMGVDFVDEPTFVLLPDLFRDGIIEVDVLGRLAPDAPDFARAFIGVAYRVRGQRESFEAVYLRPMNGQGLNPPPPRDRRAVQYFAYPDWKFDRLRSEHPDGPYEVGADIAPDQWIRLRLDLDGPRLQVFLDGQEVLTLSETKAVPMEGRIGLWVDIGTEGYFANLRMVLR